MTKRIRKTKSQELSYRDDKAPEEPAAQEAMDKPPEPDPKVKAAVQRAASFRVPKAKEGGAPPWVNIPQGFSFPRGKQFLFVRFKSEWTDTSWKGEPVIDPATGKNEVEQVSYVDDEGRDQVREDVILYRQCICWPMNVADNKFAIGRAMGDANLVTDELTKQMIRVCDGVEADWALGSGAQDVFWNEIGARCRALLTRMFSKLHMLGMEDTQDFLDRCVEVRTGAS